jgi:hypothetical protein
MFSCKSKSDKNQESDYVLSAQSSIVNVSIKKKRKSFWTGHVRPYLVQLTAFSTLGAERNNDYSIVITAPTGASKPDCTEFRQQNSRRIRF